MTKKERQFDHFNAKMMELAEALIDKVVTRNVLSDLKSDLRRAYRDSQEVK